MGIGADAPGGFEDWDMTSYVVQTIASSIYLFSAEDIRTGKATNRKIHSNIH